MGCELRLRWLMTRGRRASGPGAGVSEQADRLQPGKQRSGLQNQVSCPKVKSLLTNQLKVRPDASNVVSWQILLPTQKHINHSELCGTNRGTVCTQSHNSVGTRHERRWQGEYLFSCSLYFRWMTQTGRFAWAFFGSTSDLMYVIKKTEVHMLLNPTAGGL